MDSALCMTGRGLIVGLLALVFGGTTGCGAKTELQQPCETELVRARPSVVLMLSRSGLIGRSDLRVRGLRMAELFRDDLAYIAPDLNEASNFGELVYPWSGRDHPGWDVCDPTGSLQLPIGRHSPLEVVNAWLYHGLVSPDEPYLGVNFGGTGVIIPNLPLVEAEIRRSLSPESEGFIVMGVSEPGDCAGGPLVADNTRVTVRRLEELRQRGIRTLVLGIDTGNWRPNDVVLEGVAALAVAGGLARNDGHLASSGRHEDFAFVDMWDPDLVREELRRRVLTSYWCRGVARWDWNPDADVVATRSDGRVIPRDPTHRDGWDLVGDGQHVQIFGPSCFSIQDDRQSVRLFHPNSRCM